MTTLHTDRLSHGHGALHLVKRGNAWFVYRETDIRHGELVGIYATKRQAQEVA